MVKFSGRGGNAFHHAHADPADTDVRSDNGRYGYALPEPPSGFFKKRRK